ncbi:(2Fe-2S) ferredoxin domain-containing protein [Chloroflexus sp.]|uniref:(2Fe-2S) ferredoxin domain-containing protein n=1 Tax=Chloroflexus sp. TaxID=1904827 RepID=UPI00404AB1C9
MPKPSMNPYARHIFICTGRYCDPQGQAHHLYTHLARLLGPLGRYENPCRVKRGTTPCLGVCSDGPIVVVYPDGIWYHHVDETVLERIVQEHLEQHRPVEEYIFHRLSSDEKGSLS